MNLILEDGTRCPILSLFDIDGDEFETPPDDLSEVHAVVAEHPDGSWIAQEVGPEMLSTPPPE